jgi:hypothetical protein
MTRHYIWWRHEEHGIRLRRSLIATSRFLDARYYDREWSAQYNFSDVILRKLQPHHQRSLKIANDSHCSSEEIIYRAIEAFSTSQFHHSLLYTSIHATYRITMLSSFLRWARTERLIATRYCRRTHCEHTYLHALILGHYIGTQHTHTRCHARPIYRHTFIP